MDFHSSGREWLKISEIPSIEIKTHNRLVAQLHVPNARRIRNLGKYESNKFSQSNWIFVHNERKSSKRSCFFSWWTGMISRSSLWDTSISATTNSSQASTMNYSPHKYSNREASESSNAEVSRYHSFPRKQCETNQFPALSIFPFHLRFRTTCTTNLVMAQVSFQGAQTWYHMTIFSMFGYWGSNHLAGHIGPAFNTLVTFHAVLFSMLQMAS